MKQTKREMLRNSLMILVGSTLFALGFDLFLEPSGINCGGVSGIAMLIVYATQSKWLTVGILSAMINIPLFFFGYRQIGKYFFFGSMFGMLISSVGFDLFAKLLPVVPMDPLVAAIFGGVVVGVGLGVVFLAGASTGGTDIVARLLKLKFRNFPIGKLMLCMDLLIAVATGVVYRQFTNTLYSVITLYLSSVMLDKVVYGFDYAKVALIISDKFEEIATAIDGKLDRGVTLLQGQGFYKRSDKYVLLSAVKKKQLAQLKELVMGIDPDAFIILQDAQQVLGDGFKRYDRFEL
ncbi:MAG: YitT family protein [Faecousia sp.]|nr:YitT family protein [Bacillota bacterium]